MIVVVQCPSDSIRGALIMEAWKCGVEYEKLANSQIELWSGYDHKIEAVIGKFPVEVIHRESHKISDPDDY